MPLRQLPQAFNHPDWIFEVKYDGFRSLPYLENQTVKLVSRKQHAYKPSRIYAPGWGRTSREAVIDGEIVCLDELGRPVFNQLLFRRGTPHFCAFDLLWLNGRDLRDLGLIVLSEVIAFVCMGSQFAAGCTSDVSAGLGVVSAPAKARAAV